MDRILWLSLLLLVAGFSVAVKAAVIEPLTTTGNCERSGSSYSVVPGTDCTAYVELKSDRSESAGICPPTSVFDLELCECTIPDAHTKCADVSFYASPTKCGAALVGQGEFSSPNYPGLYPNSHTCTWTLTASPGKVVRLTFQDFELESGVGCSYDYVKVYNGAIGSKTLVRTACGAALPDDVIGESVLTVVFFTNHNLQKKGFSASFHSIDGPALPKLNQAGKQSCDTDYHGIIGTLASPNYPNAYPNNAHCIYTITVPNKVVLEFATVNIEYQFSCGRDYLEVRDGNATSKVLHKICGKQTQAKIVASGSTLYLKFVSDSSTTGPGFYAMWKDSELSGIPNDEKWSTTNVVTSAATWEIKTMATETSLPKEISSTTTSTGPSNPAQKNGMCSRDGNVYAILPGTGCKTVTQLTTGGVSKILDCPPGMLFDLTSCNCNYGTFVTCIDDSVQGIQSTASFRTTSDVTTTTPIAVTTVSSTTVASTRAPSKVTCVVNGNIYKPIKDSGCKQFTLFAPEGFWVLDCPKGLAFDLNVCYCRKLGDFTCSSGGQAEVQLNTGAAKITETLTTANARPAATTHMPTAAVTKAPPKTSCVVNGNIYRSIKGSGCTQYTLLALDGFWVLDCPKGLAFDVNACFCRKSADFLCTPESQDQAHTSTNVPKVTDERVSAEATVTVTSVPTVAETTLPPKGTCFAGGSLHSLIKNSGCLRFALHASDGLTVLDCPKGLAFDIKACVCRKPSEFDCASDGQEWTEPTTAKTEWTTEKSTVPMASPTATILQTSTSSASSPSTGALPKDTCNKNGNTYWKLKGTSCTKFVLQAPEDDQILDCPTGFAFDFDACSCRYKDDFICLPGGFDQSSLRTTAQPLTKEVSKTSHDAKTSATSEQTTLSSSVETKSSRPADWVTLSTVSTAASSTQATTSRDTEVSTLTADDAKTSPEKNTQKVGNEEKATTVSKATTTEKTTNPTTLTPATATPTPSTTRVQTPSLAIVQTSMQTAVAKDYCVVSGNVHVLVKQMKCQLYRIQKPDGGDRVHMCDSDLLFDLGACACRQKHEFVCAD